MAVCAGTWHLRQQSLTHPYAPTTRTRLDLPGGLCDHGCGERSHALSDCCCCAEPCGLCSCRHHQRALRTTRRFRVAIDAASDGDTIAIAAGTYNERDINTNGKAILISGAVDAEGVPAAIIDGQGQLGTVLVCDSGESAETIIEHLMVINALGINGAAIACIESSPTIQHCVFSNGFGAYGGGLYCDAASPFLLNCLLEGNGCLVFKAAASFATTEAAQC